MSFASKHSCHLGKLRQWNDVFFFNYSLELKFVTYIKNDEEQTSFPRNNFDGISGNELKLNTM